MHLKAWHVLKALTAALVVVAFALLPMMGGAMADSAHENMHQATNCTSDLQPGMTQRHIISAFDLGQTGGCNHAPAQKSNCCLGTFCPSVQMLESSAIAVPMPGMALAVKPAIPSAVERGLHPAPAQRPPRLFI